MNSPSFGAVWRQDGSSRVLIGPSITGLWGCRSPAFLLVHIVGYFQLPTPIVPAWLHIVPYWYNTTPSIPLYFVFSRCRDSAILCKISRNLFEMYNFQPMSKSFISLSERPSIHIRPAQVHMCHLRHRWKLYTTLCLTDAHVRQSWTCRLYSSFKLAFLSTVWFCFESLSSQSVFCKAHAWRVMDLEGLKGDGSLYVFLYKWGLGVPCSK